MRKPDWQKRKIPVTGASASKIIAIHRAGIKREILWKLCRYAPRLVLPVFLDPGFGDRVGAVLVGHHGRV